MPPSAPVNHDPALSHSSSAAAPPPTSTAPRPAPNNIPPGDISNVQLGGLDQNQIMSLLRHLPGVFNKLAEQGNLKEDAAQTLSNLSQAPFPPQGPHPHQLPVQQHQYPGPGPVHHHIPGISDPGPSSHPRGPPNLGQLSAVALQTSPPMSSARTQGPGPNQSQEMEEGASDGDEGANSGPGGHGNQNADGTSGTPPSGGGRTRGNRSATMGSDEWSRQRKDNHKEVERRRRGNINEGINELGRIVPNGSGEKAKGAILSRAVQYIHHLKENEARNIEKWTLEKLLMDQAMGDLQAQLEEVRRMWEEERMARQRAESELDVLRGINAAVAGAGRVQNQNPGPNQNGQNQNQNQNQGQNQQNQNGGVGAPPREKSKSPEGKEGGNANKRRSEGGENADGSVEGEAAERDGKRQRVE